MAVLTSGREGGGLENRAKLLNLASGRKLTDLALLKKKGGARERGENHECPLDNAGKSLDDG